LGRTKGSKNKTKQGLEILQFEKLPDLLSPNEAALWLRTSRVTIMKRIHNGEIPADCYTMWGKNYKLKKRKLYELFIDKKQAS
jgi:excisionase family DNA binding protein